MAIQQSTVAQAQPLLEYLIGTVGLKRKAAKNLLKFSAIAINGQAERQFNRLLAPGDVVAVAELHSAVATERLHYARIQVVHEDTDLIVLDKPSGLLTVATEREETDTLYFRLNEYLRSRQAGRALVVHRLDQETSGVVLFAKSERVKRLLQDNWPAVEKTYLAVVEGRPPAEQGTIKSYLTESKSRMVYSSSHPLPEARLATTHYLVVATSRRPRVHGGGDLSLLEVRLATGRKHQIRVQLAALGCPVVGDERYGAQSNPCHRLGLHARRLSLPHPQTQLPVDFESPLPTALGKLFD